ncbi:MAG: inositol monophosphatase [Deltaproteobacteria bacterium]|nr:inositol monophosphatase [Deltaproteobacteria bacterium]MBT4263519.1 inositol monophosphatase [Deltaproteobacteria bacterium]MBT4642390.1 inositol monophosphatase [Deltaproteobacteria bacterium]MBT7151641.1 inositol monophosphatase [Deltaproteobacteria bacterium]MBT7714645.1 inositol monophosphatase [Deltaproteobacteria bacterium]
MKKLIQALIVEAGLIALQYQSRIDTVQITEKGAKDLVTEADIAVEDHIRKKLAAATPDFGFLGEESLETLGEKSRWIVDPIDGTHSFIHGQYYWSISIALETEGEICLGAVYAPLLKDLYVAEKGKGALKNDQKIKTSDTSELAQAMVGTGFACLRANLKENNLARFCRIASRTMDQRRFGSAALDCCLVGDGQLDAFWEQQLNLYDVAAGALIAAEAGATVTDFSGRPGLNPQAVLITNGRVLAELLELM